MTDGSQDAGVADASMPDMSNLAMDQTANSPEYQNFGDDPEDDSVAQSGPGLLGDDQPDDADGDDNSNSDDDETGNQTGLLNGQYA